ncbi:MAG: trypsin-like peptidase domain-containing protein [Acidimicrobiales bacterium]
MAGSFQPDHRSQLCHAGIAVGSRPTASFPVAFLVVLAVLASCGDEGAASQDWQRSAVGIEAKGCGLVAAVGSGAVVDDADLVVTTAHTVAGSNEVTVIDLDGERHAAELLLIDPDQDIALLAASGLDRPPLEVGTAVIGEAAGRVAWDRRTGFRTDELTVTDRLSVTIEDIYIDHDVDRRALEFRGPVERGDSGAVLVADGLAVGVVYAKARSSETLGYALDGSELADALATLQAGDRQPVPSGDCVP